VLTRKLGPAALVNPSKRQVLGAVRAYAPHALGDGR